MDWVELRKLGPWPVSSSWFDRGLIMIAAAVLGFLIASGTRLETRMIVAWDAGLLAWEATLLWMMWHCDARLTKLRAGYVDPSSVLPVVISLIAAAFSMSLIGYLSTNPVQWTVGEKQAHMAVSLLAILATWLLVHLTFAVQYVRFYYYLPNDTTRTKVEDSPSGENEAGGLIFPGGEDPDYLDFLYYAIIVATCYATADINIDGRTIRRLTMIHAIVSFFFISVIIGLVLNFITNFF